MDSRTKKTLTADTGITALPAISGDGSTAPEVCPGAQDSSAAKKTPINNVDHAQLPTVFGGDNALVPVCPRGTKTGRQR
jgi:hypothetical protein